LQLPEGGAKALDNSLIYAIFLAEALRALFLFQRRAVSGKGGFFEDEMVTLFPSLECDRNFSTKALPDSVHLQSL